MNTSLLKMTTSVLFLFLAFSLSSQVTESDIPFEDLPPTNEFGKCYAKCKSADVYETVTKQVLLKEAATKLVKTPAVYETRSETVLVKEGGITYKVIPAVYKNETQTIMTEPEKKILTPVSATYKTESKQVLVTPARGQWVKKKKDPNCFSENPEDCYIACYEEVPAKYRTEKYQVLVAPASTREKIIPAKYTTVTKKVIAEPARTVEVPIDAEYKTIKTKVLVTPETTSAVTIPASFKTVSERRLVKEGGYTVWTEILCAAQTSSTTLRNVQRALDGMGYNVGPIDGILGLLTQTALKQFQTDKGLPIGNLNLETLKALEVNY